MRTVAVIGASTDREKYGNKAVRAYVKQGFQVFPVNPKGGEIEGLTAFKSVAELPVRPNLVSIYVPPVLVMRMLPAIASKGCDELWLNPGTESDEVVAEARKLGLNVIQACSILGVGERPADL